jgi:hypothetical protein
MNSLENYLREVLPEYLMRSLIEVATDLLLDGRKRKVVSL